MIELAKHSGHFIVAEHNIQDESRLKNWLKQGVPLRRIPGIRSVRIVKNTLMATRKLAMVNAVYPLIDRLVITANTAIPVDTESAYTSFYTTGALEEFYRAPGNPYQIAWNISNAAANGNWGSFVLIDAAGAMINRALAGITKASGTTKLILFEGSVI